MTPHPLDGQQARSILESITDAFTAMDRNWRFTYVNAEAEHVIGRNRAQLHGLTLWELFPEAPDPLLERELRQVMEHRIPADFENYVPQTGRWYHIKAYPDADGGLAVFFHDITRRKRAEEGLRQSENLLSLAAEATRIGFWSFDPHTGLSWWSDELRTLIGIGADEQGSLSRALELVHPDDAARVYSRWSAALESPACAGIQHEFRIVRPDGQERWVEERGLVVFESGPLGPQAQRATGILMDITERKLTEDRIASLNRDLRRRVEDLERAEQRLRESESRAEIAKRAASLGIHDYDVERGLIRWDDRVSEIWGVPTGEPVTYELFLRGLHVEDRDLTEAAVARAFDASGDGRYNSEYRVINLRTGVMRWIAATGQTFFREGRAVRLVGTVQDITERKEAESALRESERRLRRANEELQQFAYSVAHDLHEPLRMVTVYSELLQRNYQGQLDERCDTFIGFCLDGGRRLQVLVDDLLIYARAAERPPVPPVPVSADEVARAVLRDFADRIATTQAKIEASPLPEVRVERTHLQQILQNLVGNALKYGRREGGLRVWISAVRQGPMWRFSVEDNGIGIAPEYHEQIFSPFRRLEGSKTAGSGLGLAICQRIVQNYSGRLWVESELGNGAAFRFTLPA